MVCTSQVYRNQDLMNGEGTWIVSDAVRYSMSQVALLTKLKLKTEGGLVGDYAGIKMKCVGFKTRFTKPFQSVTIEVPYESGIDPYSGLLEAAEGVGVITCVGRSYYIKGVETESDKRQKKAMDGEWFEKVLDELEKATSFMLTTDAESSSDQLDESAKESRRKKAQNE